MDQPVNACSLTDEELAVRRGEWQAVRKHAVVREEARPDGLLMVYRGGEETLGAVSRLVEAERRCCPNLQFSVERDADELRVEVGFPP